MSPIMESVIKVEKKRATRSIKVRGDNQHSI